MYTHTHTPLPHPEHCHTEQHAPFPSTMSHNQVTGRAVGPDLRLLTGSKKLVPSSNTNILLPLLAFSSLYFLHLAVFEEQPL